MTQENAAMVKTIAVAFEALPERKRDYLIGYAEGVIAMRTQQVRDGEHRNTDT